MSLFSPDLREQLTCDTIDTYCAGLLAAIPEEHDPLNQMLQLETNCFLAAHNLNYLDKIGMAHSVKIRVPYLDTELAKLSASVPPQLKMKGSETKYLLKKVASRYVPEHIIKRPKTGFGAPIRSWLQEDAAFRENLRGGVMQVCSQWPGYFDRQQIERLFNDTVSNRTDGAYTLFALAAIESWLRQFTI
ncbi:MAG: asparagine synthase C-terminal domain-containing protein, partial [Chitinophagaceae bacterium]